MLHKFSQAHQQLNSYHHTDSLLFQFVLYEFLMTLEQVKIIESFFDEKGETDNFNLKIIEYLVKLAGSEHEYMRIFSWIYDSGVLTKLKNYSDLLSQKAEKEDKHYTNLHNATHKAWLSCLHCVDLIRSATLNEEVPLELPLDNLKKAVIKTIASIKKLTPDIKKIIPKYADDENVIFFLLRYKKSFDKLLGPAFLKGLFKTMFKEGPFEFLEARYKMRGFEHLIPAISEISKELNSV